MYEQMFRIQAKAFRALAHPRRLEIVQLVRGQELAVTDIYQMLDLPQANVSQHLAILKEAGVLASRRSGKQVYYRVGSNTLVRAVDQVRMFLMDQYRSSDLADEFTLKMKELVPVVHDPVCGMRLSPKTAGYALSHHGRTLYFCASGCLKKFKKDPAKYERAEK